ncbi:MAG: peptide/nickel transport system permease protein [Alpinimonas sp.]|jgi:peptide/nickel transport system permease protein
MMQRLFDRMGVLGCIAIGVIGVVLLAALFAPLIAPFDPTVGSVTERYLGSSAVHLLGTDQAGRDIFSRLVWGARSSLTGPIIVVTVTAIFGTGIALIAVWWGGLVDSGLSRVLDLLFAFPNLLLAMLAIAVFGPSLTTAALALAIAYIPYTARVIRSQAMRERNLPYIRSPQLQGISGVVITMRHLMPNIAPLIITGATINFGFAMIELAALSFLGLGVQPPEADWGLMISNGQQSLLNGYPAESILAGLCIVLTVASLGYVGERLGGRAAAGRKA